MKKTTQEIYNKIKEIKEKGNWIESPYRHITWIPIKEVELILDKVEPHNNECTKGYVCANCLIKKKLGILPLTRSDNSG